MDELELIVASFALGSSCCVGNSPANYNSCANVEVNKFQKQFVFAFI